MQIKDKIVLLTGGANGLGFAHATELLRNGAALPESEARVMNVDNYEYGSDFEGGTGYTDAIHIHTETERCNKQSVLKDLRNAFFRHVAILDLANANGEEAADKLNCEFGRGKVIFIVCDVTKKQELEAAFAKTVKQFGGLDIVINNAGIMDDSRWELMVQINYNGVVRGTLLGLDYMGKDKGGKGGTIVNVASIIGIVPGFLFPVYAGTKHAVIGMSRSLAQPYHFVRTGVRILSFCPSLSYTKLVTDLPGRGLQGIASPEVITATLRDGFMGQTPEHVAQSLMHMIRVGENGSGWVVENGKPTYEVAFPDVPVKKN